MAQHIHCPSMGALRRSLLAEGASSATFPYRAFHTAVRRLQEQSGSSPPPGSISSNPGSRRVRATTAFNQLNALKDRRILPSGQPRPEARGVAPNDGQVPSGAPLRFARFNPRPGASGTGSQPPRGIMVRGPSKFRMTPSSHRGDMRLPSSGPRGQGQDGLRGPSGPRGPGGPQGAGRGGGAAGGRRGGNSNNRDTLNEPGRRRREKKEIKKTADIPNAQNIDYSEAMPDAMVKQLARIQRKQWDPEAYEPIYYRGSPAALELVHLGRELCRGECPPVKIWGRLEKRIGVVGMHGAEAHLKIRRVPDGDSAPFGEEDKPKVDILPSVSEIKLDLV